MSTRKYKRPKIIRMDNTKSYTYEDVQAKTITYRELTTSHALDIIADASEIDRQDVAENILRRYGGPLQLAIIKVLLALLN